jgi:general L-amino acid transport system permease protein
MPMQLWRWASLRDRQARDIALQAALALIILAALWFFVGNAVHNIARRNLTSGFGFLSSTAGFDIPDTLISWDPTDSYARALLVGVLNTLLVGCIATILSTLLGTLLALMRVSGNLIAQGIARGFVEFVRNTPELLQIIFWYFAILQPLPPPRQSLHLGDIVFLNVRGIYAARPELSDHGSAALLGLGAACALAASLVLLRKKRALASGWRFYVCLTLLILLGPILACAAAGAQLSWDLPKLSGFNFTGGMLLTPEFVALVLGLTVYSSAFIAEIIRAGIIGVDRGQVEAARSLGLSHARILRLIVVPQALRIIIPPLTSQYLNLVKGTSLAVAIGYPDIVQLFAGSVLNQSGQAIEVMTITMALYLGFSLCISLAMNLYNRRAMRFGL